ncbi:MAG: DUF1428 family protein [Alphaproteobacteria bacterium]|nr:DUF1428 family protein [Alphaproteobacteria bacterium]
MSYVDVAVIPVPEDKVEAYKKMARTAGKYWIKHGALHYYECMGDDVPQGKVTDFARSVKCKEGETLGVSVVITRNRKHRDEVMKKVMSDPGLAASMKEMPFDGKRMIFGGFKPFVDLAGGDPAKA